MIQAMPGKVVIKKCSDNTPLNASRIYMNTTNYYYQVVSVVDNNILNLKNGDRVVVAENNIYFMTVENTEYGFVELKDIFAIIK